MHYSLILIGAHDGSKTLESIREAAGAGQVLLVEPVPFLFERLGEAVRGIPNVTLGNFCVATEDGMVEFAAPSPSATRVVAGSDQLGSLNPEHAVRHFPQLAGEFEVLPVEARSFASLLEDYDVSSIETLITDTEGYDCVLLPGFPFGRVKPRTLVFEFKHSDGVFRVGPRLAELLLLLDREGYDVSVLDMENMVARLRGASLA